jgi:hypothetical protein
MAKGPSGYSVAWVIAIALFATGCGSKSAASTTTGKKAGTPLASSRCKVPGFRVMNKIAGQLEHGAIGLGPAMAVLSHDYTPRVYFISAALKPNRLFDGDVATWIVPSISSDAGPLFSADHLAQAFSGMGRMPVAGGGTASFLDDGGPESRACATQMFKQEPRFIWSKPGS